MTDVLVTFIQVCLAFFAGLMSCGLLGAWADTQ